MKRIRLFLLIVSSTLFTGPLLAEKVDVEKAEKVAATHARSTAKLSTRKDFKLSRTVSKTVYRNRSGLRSAMPQDEPMYYVFMASGDQGFIIVSGDDVAVPVLGYSEDGVYDESNLNFKYWMDCLSQEIAEAIENDIPQDRKTKADWDAYFDGNPVSLRSVSPLIQTKWDQGAPYNNSCPQGTVTGCVATAMAQIMKYHSTPVTQTATIPAYTTSSSQTFIPAISGTSYNWGAMTNTYDYSSSEESKLAVATLMFHCGASVKMDYAASSAASSTEAGISLATYFGYDKSIQQKLRIFYTPTEWEALLKNELDASRPVLYSGHNSSSGHAFVCDGYSGGSFHFNWGWGGYQDGYFVTTALNPGSGGAGAGAGTYNQNQDILINIKPNAGGTNSPELKLYTSIISKNTADKGEIITVNAPIVNVGLFNYTGEAGVALVNASNNQIVAVIGQYLVNLDPGHGYSSYLLPCFVPKSIAAGNYLIKAIARSADSQWMILGGSTGDTDAYLTVTNVTHTHNMIILTGHNLTSTASSVDIEEPFTVSTRFGNLGPETFTGDIGVALVDGNDQILGIIGTFIANTSLSAGYAWSEVFSTSCNVPSSISYGNYKIRTVAKPTGENWSIIHGQTNSVTDIVNLTVAKAAPTTYGVSIGTFPGGSITTNKSNYASGETVTLTIKPAVGYQLDGDLSVYKTGYPNTTVSFSGSGNTRTFTMPAYGVTVAATFRNPDQDAVNTAKGLIKGITGLSVSQATAPDSEALKTWLVLKITSLTGWSETGVTISAANINISKFTAAAAGKNGSFTFTVSLLKGSGSATTNSVSGVITATAVVNAETPVISKQPQGSTVNVSASVNLSVTASVTDGGSLTYQWYKNSANNTTNGTPINNATNSSYSPPITEVGTVYYYVIVTNTNAGVNGTPTATVTSSVATVTVNNLENAATPIIDGQPQSATYVKDDHAAALTVSATSPDGGTLSYQWYSSTTNSSTGGTAINDVTGSSHTPSTATVGTTYYYVVVTNTKSSVTGVQAVTATSSVATITVNAVTPPTPTTYAVTVATLTNGTLTVSPSGLITAGTTVTLTITPATGYEPDAITVTHTGTTTQLTLGGTGNIRTFNMPASGVTVTATFKKTQALLNTEAVEEAKAAIEGGIFRIAQATGNTEASVKVWLAGVLDVLLNRNAVITIRSEKTSEESLAADITLTAFTPAITGTEANPAGTNGSFHFKGTLTKGSVHVTTLDVTGVIVAIPYVATPIKCIELLPIGETSARVINTGNLATGNLTVTLSGANADVFTLSSLTFAGLAVGGEADITLTPRTGLTQGVYTAILTVSGEGLTSATLTVTYRVTPSGIEQIADSRVWAAGSTLYISATTTGNAQVFGTNGQYVKAVPYTAGETVTTALPKGIYFVTAEEKTYKVIIK